MLRKIIARNISLPLQDFFNGTSILKTRSLLMESQYWEKDRMDAYQLLKLKNILNHAYENIPYYHSVMKEMDIHPSDITTLKDIDRLPILTKSIARKNISKIIKPNKGTKVFRGATGGTTGTPMPLVWDTSDRSFSWAAYYRWFDWMGISIGDKLVSFWGTKKVLSTSNLESLRNRMKNIYYNRLTINSFMLNDTSLSNIINQLNKYKPLFIRGYLSALIQVSQYMRRKKINLDFSPIAISSTTETLLPMYRRLIEETFHAPIYDQYGCGETHSIAFECDEHRGLHITSEHVIVQSNSDNEGGELIITNLDNYAMPIIRYENGDRIKLSKDNCACGRKLPLISEIAGRTADSIVLKDGSEVHGVFFTDILSELKSFNLEFMNRFQVYQKIPGEITFYIESEHSLPRVFLEDLNSAFRNFFSSNQIVIKKRIPEEESGKFRYIKNEIPKEI